MVGIKSQIKFTPTLDRLLLIYIKNHKRRDPGRSGCVEKTELVQGRYKIYIDGNRARQISRIQDPGLCIKDMESDSCPLDRVDTPVQTGLTPLF